ncbi:MAG: M56 family metallopeptidase, partial [Lutibacter sp.]|uniref:M56 family metallopeptidase n=1 Tax=Lutibacter sp. TaxID=1925666 RepID=UPI00385D51DF
MINYILQVILFQALFLAVYDFFLQKETFFKWNRFYLLITPILSFIVPLLKFESVQKAVPQAYVEQLPTLFLNPQIIIEQTTQNNSTIDYLVLIFYAGLGTFLFLFLIKFTKILQLISTNKVLKKEKFSLVLLENKQSAFSFFNYIFIHKHLLKNEDLHIIKHELIHCKQKHTLDLLLFEVLKIVLWFNPMVYIYQKRITVLHEYISDAEVVNETDKNTYFNKLLAETFNVENISFINQFFKHSLIKKRIVMITKEKSQKMKQLKYLLIVPLLLGMLIYSSCTDAAKDELLEMESILQQNEGITEGKYFDTKDGKIFVGKSLAGTIVSFEEYTEKEKEMYTRSSTIENSIFKFLVVIDSNGDRIGFLKTNNNADSYKNNWEYVKGEDVPFAKIEIVPVFPGCEGTNEELRKCLQDSITMHINRNFNSKLANG